MRVAGRNSSILPASPAAVLALTLGTLASSGPAVAFHTVRSPDFPVCTIWVNDEGKPLRNKLGREIAQEVPCSGQSAGRDRFKVYAGEKANTLVILDEARHVVCQLSLAPGSATIMVPTVCQELGH